MNNALVTLFWFPMQETCLGTLSFMEAHRLVEMALGYVFVKVRCHMSLPVAAFPAPHYQGGGTSAISSSC